MEKFNLANVSHSDNRVIFSRKDYPSQSEFFKQIQKQIQILLESKYAISMFEYKDEVIIEFGSTKPEYMESVPLWLYSDEIKAVIDYQARKKLTETIKTAVQSNTEDDYDPEDDETDLVNFEAKEKPSKTNESKFHVPDYLKDDKDNNDK